MEYAPEKLLSNFSGAYQTHVVRFSLLVESVRSYII